MLTKYLPRFRKAYHSLEQFAERERWSRGDIEAFQLERVNDVWKHAIAYVPYYRQLAVRRGLPNHFATLAEFQRGVPVLQKAVVREDAEQFLSEQPAKGGWKRTGGSTGTPMNCYWANAAHQEMLRTKYRFYQAWGVDIFDPVAYLWGHSASFLPGVSGAIARWKQPLEDRLRNRLRLSAYNLGRDDLRNYLEQIEAFQPVSLYGYSRALAFLAQEAEATGFECPSLKLAVLTGEPAFPHLVQQIERALKIPAVVEYGSIECGAIAAEWPDRTLRVREDVVFVETLPREDGSQDLIVSVLNNPSFPLLRYAIGDVTDEPIKLPAIGFAVLKNVLGRNNDFVVTKKGRYLHSARFDAFFKYENGNIKRFRVQQRKDGALDVEIELDNPYARPDTSSISQRLQLLVEGYPVRTQIVERIEQTAAGKHRLVVSDLAGDRVARTRPVAKATAGDPVLAKTPEVRIVEQRTPATLMQPLRSEKPTLLRQVITSPELSFLMEAHNGLSARIVEEAGFEAIWASGLSISAALGVRDSNEASWTQILEVLEFMSDATRIPILVDGDTGHGNFNNMRRFVHKLEQRNIGGVCVEDKLFPKTNSFINGTAQPLADIDEFAGKIKAGKDAQESKDFVIVARVEAFIAGWGLAEALKRAEAYRAAGADAILMHSAKRNPDEILSFLKEWGGRSPVVLVPTKYYTTPTDVFRDAGVNAVIWANHLMRSALTVMQRTAREIFEDQTLVNVEDRVAPLAEVFRLQGEAELSKAEARYLPANASKTKAIVLAASRGAELGELTADRPKCMVAVAGQPILAHIAGTYREAGIKDITVVRGYRKEAVDLDGLKYVDNDEATSTRGAYSLYKAMGSLDGECIVSYGDVLFKKYVPQQLLDAEADFAIAVDANWRESGRGRRNAEYVQTSEGNLRKAFYHPVRLVRGGPELPNGQIHGEWMGFLKLSAKGLQVLKGHLDRRAAEDLDGLKSSDLLAVLNELAAAGHDVRVIYSTGHWLDIDNVDDLIAGADF